MEKLQVALAHLRVARLRVGLRSAAGLALPEHQGSSLRGALAMTVKKLVCVRRDLERCDPCPLLSECAYPYLFETRAPPGASGTKGYESFPRPYIISYAAGGAHTDPGGGSVSSEVGLTLVGSAARYFPYLALALCELQNRGIGAARRSFEFSGVDALDLNGSRTPIFDGASKVLQNYDYALRGEHAIALAQSMPAMRPDAPTRLKVRFLGPTALMAAGKMSAVLEFGLLFGSVLRRLSMLSLGHCGHCMDLDFAALHRQANEIRLVAHKTTVAQWERYSNRQRKRVPMRGLVGDVEYEGALAPFLPALLLGSLVHVGDNCAFGMGRFIVGVDGRWLPGGWEFPGEAIPAPDAIPPSRPVP